MKYTGTIVAKHIFIVASIYTDTFAGNEGLLNDANELAILLGAGAGTTKFFNNSYSASGYLYRKNNFAPGEANQIAPVGGRFAVIEISNPTGFGMNGIHIGQDRTLGKLNRSFVEGLYYGSVLDSYARSEI